MEQLKKYAELAYQVLSNKNIGYSINKENIKSIFEYTNENKGYTKDAIIIQLTVIDSYYSTQMSKRYYGIEELSEAIIKISKDKDEFNEKLISFLNNPIKEGEIYNLFNTTYGIHKNCNSAGKAVSLISKFAYYQTGFKFPIYDRLAKKIFPLIVKKYFNDSNDFNNYNSYGKLNDFVKFYKAIKLLNEKSNIKDYNKLDNLLWLSGKIYEKSFSIILSRNDYEKAFKGKYDKKSKEIIISKVEDLSLSDEIKEIMVFCDGLRRLEM